MLTGVINLRSLVASKARLNAALRRQHCRVVNNESEELPKPKFALPFPHGFPNSLENVFFIQADYFRIAVTEEQSRSLPISGFVLADFPVLIPSQDRLLSGCRP